MKLNDELFNKTYPPYRDLEPFLEYKIDDIKDLHANILAILNDLFLQYIEKKHSIEHYNENHRIGFSISNFINTLQYENRALNDQISLYINYMSFFHISQKRHLVRLYSRMLDFSKEVEENININRTFSIDDIQTQQRLNRFFTIGDDVPLDAILEDSEFLLEKAENVLDRIDTIGGGGRGSGDLSCNIPDLSIDEIFAK